MLPTSVAAPFPNGLKAKYYMSALGQKQTHVRFTPESRHLQCNSACPLSAKSGHLIRWFRLIDRLLEFRNDDDRSSMHRLRQKQSPCISV